MNIGHKIKSLRIQKKLEPISMAELLDISINTHRKYERNESAPDLKMLEKIAKVHEISIIDLLTEDKIIFSSHQNGGTSNNALIINQLSEKLIEQFEKQLTEKDLRIAEKEERITELKEIISNINTTKK